MNEAKPMYEVLVVDDSPVYRKLVEQVLSCEKYSLTFARDGAEALRLFEECSPSFVITDLILPDFSGIELCQRLRSDASRPYTYVIVMTGNTEKGNLVKGLEAGADDYLTKPFDPAEMLARMGVGRRIVELNRELAAKSKKMEEAARTGPLTGLPNRRAIEEWAARQLRGSTRHGFALWIVVGDIDSFKTLNDSFGHDGGDLVLQAFADVLKYACSGHVRPAGRRRIRIGIDCGSLPGTVREYVVFAVWAEREGDCESRRGGVACHEEQEFSALLRKADQMLYEAKHAGRNCVRVCYPE
jgi:PleD family two-component response regulator